jgi:hypothetical protein
MKRRHPHKATRLVAALAGLLLLVTGCKKTLNYTPEVFVAQPQVFKDQAGATRPAVRINHRGMGITTRILPAWTYTT